MRGVASRSHQLSGWNRSSAALEPPRSDQLRRWDPGEKGLETISYNKNFRPGWGYLPDFVCQNKMKISLIVQAIAIILDCLPELEIKNKTTTWKESWHFCCKTKDI